ncbi:hypothetical protein ASPZODRAFT_100574, partial [Penicilliopsis zonata CBS 506.65]
PCEERTTRQGLCPPFRGKGLVCVGSFPLVVFFLLAGDLSVRLLLNAPHSLLVRRPRLLW